jgi:hypothetical protein
VATTVGTRQDISDSLRPPSMPLIRGGPAPLLAPILNHTQSKATSTQAVQSDDEEADLWLKGKMSVPLRLQRPLPDAVLQIVSRGEKEDGAPP